jgi:MFS family permease
MEVTRLTERRGSLPTSTAYALAAYIVGLGLFASVAPSPLYATYMNLWDFSPLTLTLIYATHSFGVLATLLLAGRVSDEVERRPVLLASLGLLMATTLLFIFAASPVWLFVARGLQGLATGAAIGAASAAMLDFAGERDPGIVGLTNAVTTTVGTGLGILTVSVLVQVGPEPLALPYLVLIGLLAIAFAGSYMMCEPIKTRRRPRLTAERPYIPAVVKGPFLLASLAVVSSWSVGGLFFSLGPELGGLFFNTTNTIVTTIGIVALLATAALSQLVLGRSAPWKGAAVGSFALAVGVIVIILAIEMSSSAFYLLGSAIAGFGFGISFLGGLRGLVAAIPPEHRASVMSAFYVVAYASLSIPAVVAGLVVTDVGLEETFELFGTLVALVAATAAVVAWRARQTRPTIGEATPPAIARSRP